MPKRPRLSTEQITPVALLMRAAGHQPRASDCCNRTLRMTRAEAHVWARAVLRPGASYLEWGTGGSTEAAAWYAVHGDREFRAEAVESSREWLDELRWSSSAIRTAERRGRLRLRVANIGPVRDWGVPISWESRTRGAQTAAARAYLGLALPRAAQGPDDVDKERLDAVLVDGRFRAACALSVLPRLRENGTVLVHDFFLPSGSRARVRRTGYAVVLKWFHVWRMRAGTLAIMRPRPQYWAAAAFREQYSVAL